MVAIASCVAVPTLVSYAGGARQVQIGLVVEQPLVGRGSDPYLYGAYRGLERAKRDLPVAVKVAVSPSTPTGSKWLAPFQYFAAQHYDLVIAPAFMPIGRAARRFPEVKFAVLDGTRGEVRGRVPNLEGIAMHVEQAAYLAGYLAAKMADRGPPPHVVSSVGGISIPGVNTFIAGFEAGAKRADPKIKLLRAYSGTFLAARPCANAARAQIDDGSKVVFEVAAACGLGALEVAKRKGVYGIGVDTDQSYLGKFILTSVLKNLNLAVYDFAKLTAHHRLRTGGNLTFDLHNNGVGLGKFSPRVPRWLRQQLRGLAARIENGKIVVPATLTAST